MIETMRNIRLVEHDGHKMAMETFKADQFEVCRILGIEVPSGCIDKEKLIDSATGKKIKPRRKKKS